MNYQVEIKRTWRFALNFPALFLVSLGPGVLFALAFRVTWVARPFWVSRFLHMGSGIFFLLTGLFLSFLVLGFLTVIAWDFKFRGAVDWRRGFQLLTRRFSNVLLAALILSLLVGFFSMWFIFTGFIFAFLLMFTMPALVIDSEDPFGALRVSFQMAMENLGENFVFGIISIFFLLAGYLLMWAFGFAPFVGFFMQIITAAGLLTFLSLLLGRYYLSLTRY
ncbi:MAG TPA: hypothetical protein VLH40_07210 [Atribacteraceae bacterium]|nr:hypothetical protein [Atribacteraceae bacterium]